MDAQRAPTEPVSLEVVVAMYHGIPFDRHRLWYEKMSAQIIICAHRSLQLNVCGCMHLRDQARTWTDLVSCRWNVLRCSQNTSLSSHVKHQNPWWTRHTNKIWREYRLRFATNDFATNPLAVVSGPTVFWTSDQHRTQSDPFLRWPDVSEGFVQLLRTVAWNVLGQNVPTKGTTNLTVVDGNLQAIRFQRQILLTHWTFKPNGRTLCSTTSYRHLLSVELSAMLSSRGANPD